MKDLFVLDSAARAVGKASKRMEGYPKHKGSCNIGVFTAPNGRGMSTIVNQIASVNGWPVVTLHAEPTSRSFLDDVHRGVFGCWGNYYQVCEAFRAITAELPQLGWPPLIIDNADRLNQS
jgi:hypothetical protein